MFGYQQYQLMVGQSRSWLGGTIWLFATVTLAILGICTWNTTAKKHWSIRLFLSLSVCALAILIGFRPIRRQYFAEKPKPGTAPSPALQVTPDAPTMTPNQNQIVNGLIEEYKKEHPDLHLPEPWMLPLDAEQWINKKLLDEGYKFSVTFARKTVLPPCPEALSADNDKNAQINTHVDIDYPCEPSIDGRGIIDIRNSSGLNAKSEVNIKSNQRPTN